MSGKIKAPRNSQENAQRMLSYLCEIASIFTSLPAILGFLASIAGLITLVFSFTDRSIPKPKLEFNDRLKLTYITNVARDSIFIGQIVGKKGNVADCSWEAVFAGPGPDWQSKYAIDLAILPGKTENICIGFNGGYEFKMRVKRKSLFKPREFIIILSPK